MNNKLLILVAYGLIALTGQAQKNLPRFKYSKEPAVLTGNIVGDSNERLEDVNVTIIR